MGFFSFFLDLSGLGHTEYSSVQVAFWAFLGGSVYIWNEDLELR